MTTTSNISTNFNFRTKFKKLINADRSTEVDRAFKEFCNLTTFEARTTLWRLTYSVNSAIDEVHKLRLDLFIIAPENFITFRNELRFQYEAIYPNLLMKPSMDATIEPAFSNLIAKTDKIIANTVFDYCHAIMQKNQDLDRILFLLKSERESNYFGGIRAVGFNVEEAEYLKPFHNEIYDLLAAMKDFFENDNPFVEEKEEEVKAEEKISTENNEAQEETTLETVKNFKQVTPEEILEHKDVFKSFTESDDLNKLLPIGHLGFDLNEVMIRKEEINNFIKAVDALTN